MTKNKILNVFAHDYKRLLHIHVQSRKTDQVMYVCMYDWCMLLQEILQAHSIKSSFYLVHRSIIWFWHLMIQNRSKDRYLVNWFFFLSWHYACLSVKSSIPDNQMEQDSRETLRWHVREIYQHSILLVVATNLCLLFEFLLLFVIKFKIYHFSKSHEPWI